jgi:hypothetical protein
MRSSSIILAATALAVAACSSGGGDGFPQPQANQPPAIAGLADQAVDQDVSATVSFTVSDPDSAAASLEVSARSSDTTLIPADALVLSGQGTTRTLAFTPAEDATGSATLSVTARDATALVTTRTFTVTVRPVIASVLDVTNGTFAKSEGDALTVVRGMTFVQDADDPNAFAALLQ